MPKITRPRKRTKADSRAFNNTGRFARFPFCVYQHINHRRLTAYGRMLLMDIFVQFYGKNNGNLCASWSVMKDYGWKSKSTLSFAKDELLHYGFIECTYHGGFHNGTSLYAVTWLKIDNCHDKVKQTDKPSGKWQQSSTIWCRKSHKEKKHEVR